MTTYEQALWQKLGRSTVEIAKRLGSDLEADYVPLSSLIFERNGSKARGLRVPVCQEHTTTEYSGSAWMGRKWTYHIHEDEHTTREFTKDFCARSLDFLAPGRTYAQLRADVRRRPQLPWIWQGLIRPGLLTLLVAKSGMGKSSFVSDLLAAIAMAGAKEGMNDETEFLGLPVNPANVLYFVEEDDETVNEKPDTRPLLLRSPLIRIETIPYVRPDSKQVQDTIDRALEEFPHLPGMEQRPLMVIIDTLNHFLPLADENDQFQAHEKLMPLVERARERRIAPLVLHHAPKNLRTDAVDFVEAARGASAFVGTCDIGMALFRPNTPKGQSRDFSTHHRTLRCQGRNKDTPAWGEPLYLDHKEETGYVLRPQRDGEDKDTQTGSLSDTLGMSRASPEHELDEKLIALRTQKPKLTQQQMAAELKMRKKDVGDRVKRLRAEGKWLG